MLNISAFYLVKQKSFIPKKYDLGRSQYQNKKALFTVPIFSEGFELTMQSSHIRGEMNDKRPSDNARSFLDLSPLKLTRNNN